MKTEDSVVNLVNRTASLQLAQLIEQAIQELCKAMFPGGTIDKLYSHTFEEDHEMSDGESAAEKVDLV